VYELIFLLGEAYRFLIRYFIDVESSGVLANTITFTTNDACLILIRGNYMINATIVGASENL
jgi:hypothetical protein